MAFEIISANASGAFCNGQGETVARDIANLASGVETGVIFIPEAGDTDSQDPSTIDLKWAKDLGYDKQLLIPYEKTTPHKNLVNTNLDQYLAILGKGAVSLRATRLDTFNGALISVEDDDKKISGIATHMEDRHEAGRLGMVEAILEHDELDFVVGDLNSMHTSDTLAKIINSNSVKMFAGAFPDKERHGKPLSKFYNLAVRLGSLATRLHEMADGSSLEALENAGFTDADPRHSPTVTLAATTPSSNGPSARLSKTPVFQLDHLMFDPEVVSVEDFGTHHINGTDHFAIRSILQAR